MAKSKLRRVAAECEPTTTHGIIKLLLADHKLMRSLMKEVKSKRSSDAKIVASFHELEAVVTSHMAAEERSFLSVVRGHEKFEGLALEGIEEHRVHETVLAGIRRVRAKDRKIQQMKIFCEILEHHLDEEEEGLFPRFKKYAAASTRRKIGDAFLKVREETSDAESDRRGAARFVRKTRKSSP